MGASIYVEKLEEKPREAKVGRVWTNFTDSQARQMVGDAVEPSMTFVVPLAAGIVERRGAG